MNISENITSMNANSNAIANNSYNLANTNNRGFHRKESNIVQKDGSPKALFNTTEDADVNTTKDVSQMITYQKGFEANIPVIKTENDMQDSILDIKA